MKTVIISCDVRDDSANVDFVRSKLETEKSYVFIVNKSND